MKRYQVYLDPKSVSVLDEFESQGGAFNRSQLIRSAIDRLSENLRQLLKTSETLPKKKNSLSKLTGIVKLSSVKKTNYAQQSDRIYLDD